MKKLIITAWALCLCFTFSALHVLSQPIATDSTSAVKAVTGLFNASMGDQLRIYNGREFTPYNTVVKGNPNYTDQADFVRGSVKYDGFVFKDMYLIYDIYGDQLIVRYYNKFSKVVPDAGRIAYFDMAGHHFVNIDADTISKTFKSGYYDELYGGRTRVLARYSKSIQNSVAGNDIDTYFTKAKTTYYIKTKGVYEEASSKSELLSLLKDHKKELQQYIRSNDINFKDPATALPKVAAYYDHLTP